MKRAASSVLVLVALAAAAGAQDVAPATPATPATPAASACVACHSDPARVPRPEAREPVASLADDVHAQRGLSCHDCHGGRVDVELSAPDAQARAHDAAAGYVGRPVPAGGPAFCGRCHSDAAFMARFNPDARVDQEAKYHTSVHGERLAAGDTRVASCISCHGRHPGGETAAALAHGIRAVADPQSPVHPLNVATTCGRCHGDARYMAEYGIPTNQHEQYEQSVHRAALVEKEDLSAPTCNDCHGNHGARPPEVESMAFVCGTCHAKQSELFRQTTMKPAFDELELGECIVCHGNHRIVSPTDELLFHAPLAQGAPATGCYTCHPDPADAALAVSTAVHRDIGALEASIGEARAVLADAGAKGMPVAEAEFELAGATDALVEARALVHLFRREPVAEACARGTKVADSSLAQGRAAIEDFYFRHRWLGVSLLGIAFAITSLWLKLRQVDRRWRASLEGGAKG